MDQNDVRPMRLESKSKIMIAALIIFLVITIIGPVTFALGSPVHASKLDHMVRIEETLQESSSLCHYLKQYSLPNDIRISVCIYAGRVRIDLRQFIADKATIKGIALNLAQFRRLEDYWENIKSVVGNADDINTRNNTQLKH